MVRPVLADRGYVTVFIGGNRDARPHKARSPKVRGRGEVGGEGGGRARK